MARPWLKSVTLEGEDQARDLTTKAAREAQEGKNLWSSSFATYMRSWAGGSVKAKERLEARSAEAEEQMGKLQDENHELPVKIEAMQEGD